ncbi:hypothetical protein [Nonomuraea rubra]|uniref:Uncharacterized protein n=1 Tax=Nonomuraea rubra TaxID=46180 RepID=A0A7X0P344_9ACTN|nr:hypothetical protein [Nonomuraea rubra]MBB6554151.1 hypothetical protein [Nonomuraea rubra]
MSLADLTFDQWRTTEAACACRPPDEWEHARGAGADTVFRWGGYGHLPAWLPLATANRNPNMAEFVYGPEGEDLCEDFSTRPVLTL